MHKNDHSLCHGLCEAEAENLCVLRVKVTPEYSQDGRGAHLCPRCYGTLLIGRFPEIQEGVGEPVLLPLDRSEGQQKDLPGSGRACTRLAPCSVS